MSMKEIDGLLASSGGLKFQVTKEAFEELLSEAESHSPGATERAVAAADYIFHTRHQVFSLTLCTLILIGHPLWFCILLATIGMGIANLTVYSFIPDFAMGISVVGRILKYVHCICLIVILLWVWKEGASSRHLWVAYAILQGWFCLISTLLILVGKPLFGFCVAQALSKDNQHRLKHVPTFFLLFTMAHARGDSVEETDAALQDIAGSLGEGRPTAETLIQLLDGLVQPLQQGAVQQIDNAIQHIEGSEAQGRFMTLMMHTCLASTLHCLDRDQSNLSSLFKTFAISQWERPPTMSIDSDHKLFTYSQQQLGDTLVSPNDDQLADIGITLLSIALPDQQQFTAGAALACGQAAHTCWQQANAITEDAIKT